MSGRVPKSLGPVPRPDHADALAVALRQPVTYAANVLLEEDGSRLGIQALVGLFPLPLADLIPRHAVEEAIRVADPEIARREPPLDSPPDSGAPAPTVRVATALVAARVVDPLKQRPLDSSRVAPIDSGRESASGEPVADAAYVILQFAEDGQGVSICGLVFVVTRAHCGPIRARPGRAPGWGRSARRQGARSTSPSPLIRGRWTGLSSALPLPPVVIVSHSAGEGARA